MISLNSKIPLTSNFHADAKKGKDNPLLDFSKLEVKIHMKELNSNVTLKVRVVK